MSRPLPRRPCCSCCITQKVGRSYLEACCRRWRNNNFWRRDQRTKVWPPLLQLDSAAVSSWREDPKVSPRASTSTKMPLASLSCGTRTIGLRLSAVLLGRHRAEASQPPMDPQIETSSFINVLSAFQRHLFFHPSNLFEMRE